MGKKDAWSGGGVGAQHGNIAIVVWQACAACIITAGVLHLLVSGGSSPSLDKLRKGRYAYVTVVCDEEMAKSGMLLVHSLKSSGTAHDVVVLSINVGATTKAGLHALGATLLRVPLVPPEIAKFSNMSWTQCTFLKIAQWNMMEYERIVYLDHNQLVISNVDELFQRPDLTAAPDNNPPDRFNDGLMVLEPSSQTFIEMLTQFSNSALSLPLESPDLIFFNSFFADWPRMSPQHHLEYYYNALPRLGYSATWSEWVHPHIKMLHFVGTFERWNEMSDKRYPQTRRYDHIRWNLFREMHAMLAAQNVQIPVHVQPPPEEWCQTDYMEYSRGAPLKRLISVVVPTSGDSALIEAAVRAYSSHRFVYKIYLLFPSKARLEAADPAAWNSSQRVELIVESGGSGPGGRFSPIENLATDAILMCDDNIQLSPNSIFTAYKAYSMEPHRLIGFFPSAHFRDEASGDLKYIGNPHGDYSMVLSKCFLMHADYLQSYSCTLSKEVRDYVEAEKGCEDIALNFIAARVSKGPPLLVQDPDKREYAIYRDGSRPVLLDSAMSVCLNDIAAIAGYMPLQNTSQMKLYVDKDVFTKREWNREFNDGTRKQLNFEAVFDPDGHVAGTTDESYRFMAAVPRVNNRPEVMVWPSPATTGQRKDAAKILCMMGQHTCAANGPCNNTYAFATYETIPEEAELVLGTTAIVHSRHGFEDHFHSINILANLLYPMSDYGFLNPTRALFFQRGAIKDKLSTWTTGLIHALMGDHIATFRPQKESMKPRCYERAIVTRRYTTPAHERSLVLRLLQQRSHSFCRSFKGLTKPTAARAGAWYNSTHPKGDEEGVASGAVRVLVLYQDSQEGGIANIGDLIDRMGEEICTGIESHCKILLHPSFPSAKLTFCDEVLLMGSADVLVAMSSDTTMNSVLFMRGGAQLLEVLPFGIEQTDSRYVPQYQNAAKWMGVEHTTLREATGPKCTRKEATACRFFYRRRKMTVNIDDLITATVAVVQSVFARRASSYTL